MELNENEIIKKYNGITDMLIRNKKTVTVMESATSGMIASLLTDAEGATEIFKGSYVAYSNDIKIKLGIPSEIIDKYSVYSEETAASMARCCRIAFGADIGIGITGTLGNADKNNAEHSAEGKVYIAVDVLGKNESHRICTGKRNSRHEYKLAVAEKLYDILTDCLKKEKIT